MQIHGVATSKFNLGHDATRTRLPLPCGVSRWSHLRPLPGFFIGRERIGGLGAQCSLLTNVWICRFSSCKVAPLPVQYWLQVLEDSLGELHRR